MSKIKGPAPNPCESCPYRQDVPSGVWSAQEYAKLHAYDPPTYAQSTRVFQCHQSERDSAQARVCAGWVACHGPENLLALRLAAFRGDVPYSVIDYRTLTPVFESGFAAALHGMRDIDEPGPTARALVEKIAGNREDVRYE